MKSPIKDVNRDFKSLSVLKNIIPKGSTIKSFLFFGGSIEFNLAEDNRFVSAHTTKYVIYEFWQCLLEDKRKVLEILNCDPFKFKDENIFGVLQENWAKYNDPFIRAALFFLLNRCSETGMISSGKLDQKNFHPLALSYIKRFEPKNFHLTCDAPLDVLESIDKFSDVDFLLFPIGDFQYNLLEQGKSVGYETEQINHRKLKKKLDEKKHKWILIYNYHSYVFELYKDYQITMIDRFGRKTIKHDSCEEIIVTNF